MSRNAELDRVIRRLKPAASDAELLSAFIDRRDAEAFRAIVERYAPMIGGVCRRILKDEHAVEDAVQITFIALSRRPRPPESKWTPYATPAGVAERSSNTQNPRDSRGFSRKS